MSKNLSKQYDLFVSLSADYAPTKSNRDLMERSWFDLSKSRKRQLIQHTTKDGSWVKIHSDKEYGLATIYDMDILLFITSMLMDKKNKGQQLSRRITFTGYEYFYFTNKHRSGRADKQLQEALTRLHTTRIETSIRSEDKRELYSSFYWISEWQKMEKDGRAVGYSIVLPDWIFDSITSPRHILTLDEEYFHIAGGLTRWLYLYCRKARSPKARGVWKESFQSIYTKSGMKSPTKVFRKKLREVISKQSIPNYYLEENEEEILTIHRTRKTLRQDKDEVLDLIATSNSKTSID